MGSHGVHPLQLHLRPVHAARVGGVLQGRVLSRAAQSLLLTRLHVHVHPGAPQQHPSRRPQGVEGQGLDAQIEPVEEDVSRCVEVRRATVVEHGGGGVTGHEASVVEAAAGSGGQLDVPDLLDDHPTVQRPRLNGKGPMGDHPI